MRPSPEPIDGAWTLQRVVDERVLGAAERACLVSTNDRVTGLITARDVTKVPRDRWPETRVDEAMVRADDVIVVGPETSVIEAMQLMQRHDVNQLPVLQDGHLVGLLTRADVIQQIELRTVFGRDREDETARSR
jgi:CBS domain-containing protein